jgi:hypothetical protein
MDDKKLAKFLIILLLFPLSLAYFSEESFRYPCQNPANWDKEICQKPLCDVTRTCPEHIFKGQRDPKLGPPNESNKTTITPVSGMGTQGVNCGK